MDKTLSFSSYLAIGSMLFGLFFGAGNLIFAVYIGQEAGLNINYALFGFLITAIGMPFLGILAIAVSKSNNLFDLASRIHPKYGYFFTILLYLTIGPMFALPRTATVPFEIGISPYILSQTFEIGNLLIQANNLFLFLFTFLFFILAFFMAIRPSNILIWVGKILNPIFLVLLFVLIIFVFLYPISSAGYPQNDYINHAFVKGFLEGYNTMDTLASLAFGIIIINIVKNLGVTSPKYIAINVIKSGIVSLLFMAIIYICLAYIGMFSSPILESSNNGGMSLAVISKYYFGIFGNILLGFIITIACLTTAVGLIVACSEIFIELFPKSLSYKIYVIFFTIISFFIANIGLAKIISFSLPMLMFLYPLAITLIFLALLSPLFNHSKYVYITTTFFTFLVSILDFLKQLGKFIDIKSSLIQSLLEYANKSLPFYNIGMGWILPAIFGFLLGYAIFIIKNKDQDIKIELIKNKF